MGTHQGSDFRVLGVLGVRVRTAGCSHVEDMICGNGRLMLDSAATT